MVETFWIVSAPGVHSANSAVNRYYIRCLSFERNSSKGKVDEHPHSADAKKKLKIANSSVLLLDVEPMEPPLHVLLHL